MSTSLAEQLKRLQLPQTSLLLQDKKKASLLFDPKEAATLKRETVFQIGIDGLEELISKNAVFEQFRNTLFDITSKEVQRSVQSKDFNEKLNKEIKKFLLLLSPYFLLNSAHKALEWLIHRFNINQYNREDILMLILPYHESNIFVRTLQILKFSNSNDNFVFLKTLQKPGLHLTKSALLNHAATSPIFLKFVSDFLLSAIKVHENPTQLTVIFNFYCSVFLGALEYSENITEIQISQMLPSLLKGFTSDIPDFCASNFVILARLVSKADLTEKVLDKLMIKISQLKVETLKTEAVLVMIIIYQSQKHYLKIPQKVIENFTKLDWFVNILQDLNTKGSYIYPFLERIIKATIDIVILTNDCSCKVFLKSCVDHLVFDCFFIKTFISMILDSMKTKSEFKKGVHLWLREIMEALERQYPEPFEREVYRILSAKEDSQMQQHRKYLKVVLKESMRNEAKFAIFEKLNHPNPYVRSEAVIHAAKEFTHLKEADKESIKVSLIERLNDDKCEVVKKTLEVVTKLPIEVSELKNHLKLLAFKCEKTKDLSKLSGRVLKALCLVSNNNDWDIFAIIYSYLLSHSIEANKKILKDIAQSPFNEKNCLLQVETLLEMESNDTIITAFIKSLNNNTNISILQESLKIINNLTCVKEVYHKYLLSFFLSNILPEKSDIEISSLITNLFLDWFESSPKMKKACKSEDNEEESSIYERNKLFLDSAKQGELDIEGFLSCLDIVFTKTNFSSFSFCNFNFSKNSQVSNFFVSMSNILFGNYKSHKSYCESFLNKFCDSTRNKIEFLLNLSISDHPKLGSHFPETSIKVALNIVTTREATEIILSYNSSVIPSLLVLLNSDRECVRKHGMKFIMKIANTHQKLSNSYLSLLEGIAMHKDEVLLDHTQLPTVVHYILSNMRNKAEDGSRTVNALISICCNEKSPIYLRSGICEVLSLMNSVDIFEKTCISALKLLETNKKIFDKHESIIIEKNISRFDMVIAKNLKIGSSIWKFIDAALKNDTSMLEVNNTQMCSSIIVLKQVDSGLFAIFDCEAQQKVLDLIIEVATVTQNPSILPTASQFFKHIDLDSSFVLDHLTRMRDVQSPKQDSTKRKRRVTVLPTVDILDTLEWRKGMTILEFVQDKKKIRNTELILPVMFEILKKCLDFDEQVVVEYAKQLLLSSILNCCNKLNLHDLPESVFNMELIVQCIRASQNPQTHHHALLVLAETANSFPNQVLHHIMAIFTFMGSSVLRHDDAYSFQILTKIIDEIIPILVGDDSTTKIGQVLRVFVDAILDVPEHRRIPLYKMLLTKIQARENLYLFLLLVFEFHIKHNSLEKHKKSNDVVPRLLDVSANLCREFSPDVTVHSCIKLIEYLKSLPDDKDDTMETDSEVVTFNIQKHTAKEFRHYKYTLILFIANLLSSKEFVAQVAEMPNDDLLEMEPLYKDMIINILTYIQRITKTSERNINTPQSQYWKIILHHSYDILDSINALLTPEMFLLVLKGLMVHNLGMVRRRALELLNSKLQYNSSFFESCNDTDMFSLIPSLLSIIETIKNVIDTEQEIIIQTGLLSLKLLVKAFCKKNVFEFKKILEFIVTILKSGKAKDNVLASVILCLAELCTNLGAHAIPSLPHYMPSLLKILKYENKQGTPSLLLLSVLTALHKIFEHLSLFLSPYLTKILCELSLLLSKYGTESDDQKVYPIVAKLSSLKQKMGTTLPPRVLIPAVEQTYVILSEKNCFNSVCALMDILAESLKNMNGPDINSHLQELTNFFLTSLQFRADEKASIEVANIVEKHVIKALTTLVLKLSENSFRPLFYKLYDWAVRNEVRSERIITFYNLASEISENLKGLFVLFAGHLVKHAAETLDALNKLKNDELYFIPEEKNLALIEKILKTLQHIFLYDSQKFVNKDRFDSLMQPIVDQLENVLGGVDKLEKRSNDIVIPCIVAFTTAVGDDSLWKQMNYQILLKMRHNMSSIRLIALKCLTEIVKKLGDEFLPLLPETIPFLAELLEDDAEHVEKACQKAVQEMEKYLGESLQKYF